VTRESDERRTRERELLAAFCIYDIHDSENNFTSNNLAVSYPHAQPKSPSTLP
jgi:hypothetical protein